jgi:CMP-N-acetylneuraminic acid synthetase
VQPTSPVRPHFDLETITEHLHENGSAVTVSRINEPHPYKLKVIDDGALNSIFLGANSEVSRQLLPEVYQLTGSLYIINGKILVKNKKMLVDPCRPIFQEVFFNIDTEKDFKIAEHMCFK